MEVAVAGARTWARTGVEVGSGERAVAVAVAVRVSETFRN